MNLLFNGLDLGLRKSISFSLVSSHHPCSIWLLLSQYTLLLPKRISKRGSAQRFQNPMLGTGQGFGYNHALFWCQWLPMDETNLLGWSLNMTSTCLEHKTRIAQAESRMEKKPLFHDVAYAKIGHYWLVNNIIYHGQVGQMQKKIFQP